MKSRIVRWLAYRVLPRYETDAARVARLDTLRQSLMSEWEGSLMMGEGNDANGVPFTMLVGLVDVARFAQLMVSDNPPPNMGTRLRGEIDDYLRDLDTAKWRRTYR